ANDNSSGSNDEDWSHGVDDEISNLKSKKQNVTAASLSTSKKGKTTPESSTAMTSCTRLCPKPLLPLSTSIDKRMATELFDKTTHAGKWEMINQVKAETDGTSKVKSVKK
ncbi:hypothetical protein FRC11_012076, partial [Ceratobasidium sp. 423]